MKKAFFSVKRLLCYSDPRFEKILNKLYLSCLSNAGEDPKFFSEAYILLKDLLENMPIWFRLNSEEEEIPYTYVWKSAEMGKLAYNLNKKKKAWEWTEKAYEIVKKTKLRDSLTEIKELK